MDEDTTDIGRLWQDALDRYCKDIGTNAAQYLPQTKWSISAIVADQQRQVETFNKYRHNKGLTDRFRSLISKNSDVIQSVADNVANAASSAFPPSAAILTAFTYVMRASKNVSEDYDQVLAFFDIVSSLLERLSLMESKLPSAKNYQKILMRVFSSIMGLCGTATKYVTDGRFKHWLKALYKGSDDDIKADYTKLETNIQRLESATMFATLATVIETKSEVKDLTVMTMQSLKVGTQTLSVSMETNVMMKSTSSTARDTFVMVKKLKEMMKKDEARKETEKVGGAKNKAKDSGAKKNAALNEIKRAFVSAAEPAIQLRDIQTSFVLGTFSWIAEEQSFKDFMDDDSSTPFLWIHGPPGIGKSCLAYSIIKKLWDATANDQKSSVSYFFFNEEIEPLRSVKAMLSTAIIQTAIANGKYRDEAAAELNRWAWSDDLHQLWDRYFAAMYPKDSDRKLFMVLDGLDEADDDERATIFEILTQIRKDELNIQVLFTSRMSDAILNAVAPLEPAKVEMTREKISTKGGDLWKIIMKRCRTLPKLKRLNKQVIRKIGAKLRLKADSVLYAEHMLRRLNVLGRESLIIKELETLPDDLPKLYELLLSECQKHRSSEQFIALKKLFAWLAYSQRPLTLGEATALINFVPGATNFSLEEEIDGRSARILDIATEVADDGSSSEESDSEVSERNEEESPENLDKSITSPLKFQERSMRQYFKAMEVDEKGLRSSPSLAHFTIFEMAVRILNTHEDDSENGTGTIWGLRAYAAKFWMQHFLELDPKAASDEELKIVVDGLHTIIDPNGEALKNIEIWLKESDMNSFFGDWPYPLREPFFDAVRSWFERSMNSHSEILSAEVLNEIKLCSSEAEILSQLARGHIKNWFETDRSFKARRAFEFARNALQLGNLVPGLSEAASLVENSPDVESDILLVSNAFSDIEKTPSVWKAIAMAFFAYKLYDQCLKYLTKCLEMTESDTERYHMLCFIGDVELSLSQLTDDGEEEIEHIHKAYDSINKGLGMMVKEEVRSFAERETWKSILQGDITNRGRCEIKLGKLDKAIESLGEAYGLIDNVDEFFIKDLTSELEKRGEYEKLISVVHQLKLWDLLYWIGFHTAQGHETFQHAAVESRNQAFLIETYERLIKQVDSFELGAHIRIQLAAIYQFVVPNYSEAKRLLFEIVDPQKGTKFQDADEDSVFNARLQIADILMEQFRAAVDPKEKIALASETKNLALQHSLAISNDFNPYESQTAITLALMLAKLGPMSEFQDLIEKTFQVCIAALTDTLAWNDSQGFRLLAKVLSFVPDMKRDAQIAYSLQFSNVDDKILHPPEEIETAEKEEQKEGLRNEEVDADTKELPIGDTPSKAAAELPGETVQDDPPEAKVEDLNPASDIYCNGCSRTFSDWTKGSVYMCIVCTNCDLCEECWTKRDRCNKGEEWKDWKRYCGDDHRYIRGPIKGWKGVKDGVLRLAGEDGKEMIEILFTQWVAGIQDRWKEAWLGFWKRDVLVVNIL